MESVAVGAVLAVAGACGGEAVVATGGARLNRGRSGGCGSCSEGDFVQSVAVGAVLAVAGACRGGSDG